MPDAEGRSVNVIFWVTTAERGIVEDSVGEWQADEKARRKATRLYIRNWIILFIPPQYGMRVRRASFLASFSENRLKTTFH
ncbi:hypothetical protein GCM10023183_32620 [Nibribacter koreensis]|uniref:Uncharacterized protein n=1 Tax=Nibribacter koreensis TaxID=1084519 RepID=A0ABP8FXR2_9BACT